MLLRHAPLWALLGVSGSAAHRVRAAAQTSDLSVETKKHLSKTYLALTATLVRACAGAAPAFFCAASGQFSFLAFLFFFFFRPVPFRRRECVRHRRPNRSRHACAGGSVGWRVCAHDDARRRPAVAARDVCRAHVLSVAAARGVAAALWRAAGVWRPAGSVARSADRNGLDARLDHCADGARRHDACLWLVQRRRARRQAPLVPLPGRPAHVVPLALVLGTLSPPPQLELL